MFDAGRRRWVCKFRNPTWLEPLYLRDARIHVKNADVGQDARAVDRNESLRLLSRNNYALLYDTELRIAIWCGFYLTKEQVKAARRFPRDRVSFTDRTLPKEEQVTPSQMQRCGFDKGHMAPHASVVTCSVSNLEASLLSNFVLQHKVLNRGVWKRLETLSRCYVEGHRAKASKLLIENSEEDTISLPLEQTGFLKGSRCLAVSTGVLFKKGNESLSHLTLKDKAKRGVPVPDELYMALWDVHSHHRIAFILPNNETSDIPSASIKHLLGRRKFPESQRMLSHRKENGYKRKRLILPEVNKCLEKAILSDILHFRVTIEELEKRIVASEGVIAESLFCQSPNGRSMCTSLKRHSGTEQLGVLQRESPLVELFPLQKRRHACRMLFIRILHLKWLRTRRKSKMSQ
ncbi:putative DNA/RNA non-specific endonuclease protein-like [Trypanosoma grayi]|uniref:putative DNA/RNA non-specific endonuclease protein-like n=1 Tax=Trypanosoma grayi TaxID=71804 RepID=UPI0004F43C28|nr:putative DNA/RNA non-specific endonuclease protein-like [Trypanosoma grayi]KEG07059.1 putative DNA/RNA non-specific endonuclease protein-like [Trypanosoma grayi]